MENAFSHMLWYYIICKPEKDSKKYLSHAGSPDEAYAYKRNGFSAIVTRYTETEETSGTDVEGLVRSVLESPTCTAADKVMVSIKDLFRSMNVSSRLIVVFHKDSDVKMGTNIAPEKRVDLIGTEFRAVVIGYWAQCDRCCYQWKLLRGLAATVSLWLMVLETWSWFSTIMPGNNSNNNYYYSNSVMIIIAGLFKFSDIRG